MGARGVFGGYDAWNEKSQPTDLDLLSAFQDTVYACVNLIANSIADVDFRLCVETHQGQAAPRPYTLPKLLDRGRVLKANKSLYHRVRKAEQVHEITNHPFLDLIEDGSSTHSHRELLSATQTFLELTGNAYWLIRFGYGDRPEHLYLLPPQNMTLMRDGNGFIETFRYSWGETHKDYSPEEIIHFRFQNPTDLYGYGYSPLRGCWQRVQLQRKEVTYLESVVENFARPDLFLSPPDGVFIPPVEADRLAREFYQRFRAWQNGGVMVATDGLKPTLLNYSPKDVAEAELYKTVKTAICNAFHVPETLLDLIESNRAGAEQAMRSFQLHCLRPRVDRLIETINHKLCPYFDDRLFLAAEEFVTEDEDFKLQEWQVKAPTRTVNELRALDGLPPIEGGDKLFGQGSASPAPSMTVGGEAKKVFRRNPTTIG